MKSAPLHPREAERIQALRATGLLDSLPESGFDHAVALASRLARTPIALVSLVDDHRQWFKARAGLDATETPRDVAFCAHAILAPSEPFVVPNALADDRFHDNPLAIGAPHVVFYAGIPLKAPESGLPLGTLCVIDNEPRQVDDDLIANLQDLAGTVESLILVHQTSMSLDVALKRVEESEAQLVVACEQAKDAARSKAMFVATMSHEIRTPLNGLIGMGELLRGTKLDPTQKQYAQTLVESAEVLNEIVSDVLDFSKLESGAVQTESIAFDPLDVAEKAASCFEAKAFAKGVSLSTVPDPALAGQVLGDPRRVRQILLNLIGNALKFTDEGGVTVNLSHRKGSLTVSVSDTGIGIPTDAQAKIFEVFTQADQTTTRRFGGTGLGLSICQRLAAAMGGAIEVASEVGRGSTFTLTVPARAVEERKRPLAGRRIATALSRPMDATALEVRLQMAGATTLPIKDPAELGCNTIDGLVTDLASLAWSSWVRSFGRDAQPTCPLVVVRPAERAALDLAVRHTPLVAPFETRTLVAALMPESPTAAAAKPVALRGRVLVADDDPVNRMLATRALEATGLEVVTAKDGQAALESAAADAFDLVLVDIHMPSLSGREVARQLHEREATPPILAFTAGERPVVERPGDDGLFDGWICKPARQRDIQRAVAAHLQCAA